MQGTMQTTNVTTWQRWTARWGGWMIFGGLAFVVVIASYAMNPTVTGAVLASTVRQATPLVLGALCGLMGERSGVINIGIEGQMLMAAFIGFLANVYTGNLFVAVMAAVLTGAILGAVLAFMSVTLKIDQIIGGTVINILALGLTGYFYTAGLTPKASCCLFPWDLWQKSH
jgi:ABC-type uncharacterized transport system permease subunit